MPLTPFDIFVVIVALVAAALGFHSGFINQLGSLVGIIVGIVVCRIFGTDVLHWLEPMTSNYDSTLVTVLVYTIMFLAVYFIVLTIAGLIRRIVHGASLGIFDRAGGAVYKMALWIFLLSLVLNLWVAVVPSHQPNGVWTEHVVGFAPTVIGSDSAKELWTAVTNGQLPQTDED